MKHSLIAATLFVISLPALADYSDDCKDGVAKDAAGTAVRKMSTTQQDEIKHMGDKLCLKKSLMEIDKELVVAKTRFIDNAIRLNASYCGPSPELLGREEKCARAALEVREAIRDRGEKIAEMAAEERRIKGISNEYDKLLRARPLQNVKIDPAVERKRVASAAIAKVRRDILESMKDPDSAKFRRITTSSDGSLVCGEVNSKNAMGGYVGFRKFANIDDKGLDFFFYEDSGNVQIAEACGEQARR